MQFTQESFGSAATALTFLVQSLPALLASKRLALLVPRERTLFYWSAIQVVLAVLTAALVIGKGTLVFLLLYLAVATTVKTVGSTLLLAMVSDHVAPADRASTFTSLGAVGSVTLTVSPAAGGALAAALGYDLLLLLDAVSFLGGIIVLAVGFRGVRTVEHVVEPDPAPGSDTVPATTGTAAVRRLDMRAWMLFAVVGAGVNVIEFPVLNDVHGLDVGGVGWVLAAYGAGGLIAFVLGLAKRGDEISAPLLATVYVTGLGVWLVGGFAGALMGFVVAGACYGLLSGRLRRRLDDDATRIGLDPIRMWGSANQIVIASNVVIYGVGSAAFAVGVAPFPMALVVVATALMLVVAAFGERKVRTASGG